MQAACTILAEPVTVDGGSRKSSREVKTMNNANLRSIERSERRLACGTTTAHEEEVFARLEAASAAGGSQSSAQPQPAALPFGFSVVHTGAHKIPVLR